MSDLFIDKNIDPMLMYETEPFDSDEYIYELKLTIMMVYSVYRAEVGGIAKQAA